MAAVNRGVWGGDGSSLPRGKLKWPGPILGRSCGKDMALSLGYPLGGPPLDKLPLYLRHTLSALGSMSERELLTLQGVLGDVVRETCSWVVSPQKGDLAFSCQTVT